MADHDEFRAFVATIDGDNVVRGVATMTGDDLAADGVLVQVHWSSVNYKDALATIAKGRVAQISPLIPGVDLAGVVVEPADSGFEVGTEVLAHGYDVGVAHHGGFGEFARVPAQWVLPVPDGLTMRDTMVLGTAGFTAALSIVQLEERGLTPDAGPVVVTGATGGVGSTAVNMLSALGYEVIASTGTAEAEPFLRSLGASAVIDRNELSEPGKPLQKTTWAAGVDCVGGTTLANVLARCEYGGAVAASGLVGGPDLPATVMPFILRGVGLLGVDSVNTPMERRLEVWRRLGTDLRPAGLEEIGTDIDLDGLEAALTSVFAGKTTGRSIVKLH
jgi:putative YhdH/YhfP family quinone oxidoreductase